MTKQPAKPRKPPVRRRPVQIRVMVTEAEQKKLFQAARKADLPLSTFVRKEALDAALAQLEERMAAIKKKAKRDEGEG
jgi:hypothetical protein